MKICVVFSIAFGAMMVMVSGCKTTEPISPRTRLTGREGWGSITALTRDSTKYVLEGFWTQDSTLSGWGTATRNGIASTFNGSIPLKDIGYLARSHNDAFKTLVAVAACTVVGYYALSALSSEGNLAASGIVTYHGPPGNGTVSCPYVYSCRQGQRILEAEAFGVAWGRGLEMRTRHVLSSAQEEGGLVRVVVTNERPETHYLNAVSLYAVETEPGVSVVAGAAGSLWPVHNLVPPRRAMDRNGRDVLSDVLATDDIRWRSDGVNASGTPAFGDTLEIDVPCEASATEGLLVIRAINTPLIEVVLEQLAEVIGDDQLEFVRSLDSDSELVGLLRNWTAEASLSVSVWDGNAWRLAGTILPEATQVSFTRAIRIHKMQSGAPVLRIRLTSLAAVWEIDRIGVDWTGVTPLVPVPCAMENAAGPGGEDVSSLLSYPDDMYLTVFPGEAVDLSFRALPPTPGRKITYAIDVQGYLHEWLKTPLATMSDTETSWPAKLACLKTLMRARSLLLPAIYRRWEEVKGRLRDGRS